MLLISWAIPAAMVPSVTSRWEWRISLRNNSSSVDRSESWVRGYISVLGPGWGGMGETVENEVAGMLLYRLSERANSPAILSVWILRKLTFLEEHVITSVTWFHEERAWFRFP